MDFRQVERRSNIVLEIIEEKINKGLDLDNPDLLDAYKATFCLAKRDLNLYRRSFSESGLHFCTLSTEAVWEDCSYELQGTGYLGLSDFEKQILEEALERLSNRLHIVS